jgi:hypothetical protein
MDKIYYSDNITGDSCPVPKTSCTIYFGGAQDQLLDRLMSRDEKNISAYSTPLRCDSNRRAAVLRRRGRPAAMDERSHGRVVSHVLKMMRGTFF